MPAMFLRAGALSLALLLASRLLGLLRETAQAAAFGATGMGDLAVLMFSLPDWLTGVLAAGALSYVLLPAWAHESPANVAAVQARVGRVLLALGLAAALALAALRDPLRDVLAAGLPAALAGPGALAVVWAGAALPFALLAALWATRLQHERDFTGMYAANLVVNGILIATLVAAAMQPGSMALLGAGLIAAMAARLAWLHLRLRRFAAPAAGAEPAALAPVPLWAWAIAAAGLPLALPFAARSIASGAGEGALATFNYAWKLVELPLLLAIQLVATLALPAMARAFAPASAAQASEAAATVRAGFALAWVLACAAAAALLLAAPAVARLLFGWGRMQPEALAQVAEWGRIGAWGLLPQALIALATAVLAAQRRMAPVGWAHGAALGALLLAAAAGVAGGAALMAWLNGLLAAVAALLLVALRLPAAAWFPARAVLASAVVLAACALVQRFAGTDALAWPVQLALGVAGALATLAAAATASADLRHALRR
jgi:putative peptidoglycan lipid II flippase